jgi:hypothetical protein
VAFFAAARDSVAPQQLAGAGPGEPSLP